MTNNNNRIEDFISGTLMTGNSYKFFVPQPINKQWIWSDSGLNTLLEKASIQLGQLNSYARLVPNVDLFIHLHVTKEAVISSRIEGTRTNIDEAFFPVEYIAPARKDDWIEVNNYTKALNFAIGELATFPLSSRLLRRTHKILLNGVRGKNKLPGDFRRSQNWLGGASLSDAVFIPPAHTYIDELMSDFELFLHNDEINVPSLVRIAIAHYQFETIHPFLDGNGRIGRLLIPLYLVSRGVLEKPLLYLSAFFEKNKELYYDNLSFVRSKNQLLQWVKYFLIGIEETSADAITTFTKVLALKTQIENELHSHWGRRLASAYNLLQYLMKTPVVRIKDVENVCKLSKKAAGDLVESFVKSGFLNQFSEQSRNRVFVFEQYINLFK